MIDWTKHIVAVGVGIADRLVQDWDANVVPPRTESFKNARDLGRLGVVLAGLGIQAYQPRYALYGEAMSVATTPMLVQSVWKAIGGGAAATRRVTYTPTRRNVPQDAASRHPAPTLQSEFRDIRM